MPVLYMKSLGLQTLIETQTGIVLPQNMVKKPSLLQKILNRTVKKVVVNLHVLRIIPIFASQKCIWEAPLHPSAL